MKRPIEAGRIITQYHFSLGNSSEGPIGYCARIDAGTLEGAVERLRSLFWRLCPDQTLEIDWEGRRPGEYLHVYFNPERLSVSDSDPDEDDAAEDQSEPDCRSDEVWCCMTCGGSFVHRHGG